MPNLEWEEVPTPKILIIDDNPTVHDAFNEILRCETANKQLEQDEALMFGDGHKAPLPKPTYITEHALSGTEGVEKVRSAIAAGAPYQVAFVDIRMPGIDGVETIARMWELDASVQTVICTAYADYQWEDLATRFGPTDRLLVLKKPFHDIEVMQLASTLAKKWFLARQAAMKFEEAVALVSQRTQKLLEIQRRENLATVTPKTLEVPASLDSGELELPVLLVVTPDSTFETALRGLFAVGFVLMIFREAEAGMIAARENVPDLILVDSRSAREGGLQLCRTLKAEDLTRHIPLILLGASETESAQMRALEAGVNELIPAPVSWPLLKARVENVLANRRQLHEHFHQLQTVQPRELAGDQQDAEFLRRVVTVVEKNLADYEFDVEQLARQLAMSRRQLFRKFKALAGCTPNVFVRDIRLKKAAQLLSESRLTVSEIIYAVGFSDPKYFRNIFKERYGVLPGEYGRPNRSGGE